MKLIKNISISFLYIVLILYSLEILALIFLDKKNNLIDFTMDDLRINAINKIPNFDKRGDYKSFLEEKTKNNISPSFKLAFSHLFIGDYDHNIKDFLEKKIKNKKKIPFRGPINKKSLGSNEEGLREIIINDRYGYKNPNYVYEKKIDLMLLGDSFAEGMPFGNINDITGVIRKNSNLNVINYGVSGTGPLLSLAVLKEYGKIFKPNKVYYLFYEGNDLDDMMNERNTFLKNYLNNDYTQNLFESIDEIKIFLNDYEKIFYNILPKRIENENSEKQQLRISKSPFKEKVKDFLELNTLKELLFSSSVFYAKQSKIDFLYFEKIINKMNLDVKNWNGKLYLVYLPSWLRYNNKYSLANLAVKNKIKKIAEKNNIQFIDIDKVFNNFGVDNTNIYNLGIYGHYTKYGYKIIANKIVEEANK